MGLNLKKAVKGLANTVTLGAASGFKDNPIKTALPGITGGYVDPYEKKKKSTTTSEYKAPTVEDMKAGFEQDLSTAQTDASGFLEGKQLAGNETTIASRELLAQNLSSSAESQARREQATRGLQGAEATQNRQLAAQLGSSGLRGGLAAGAAQDLSIAQLNNRRAMEQDLYLADQSIDRDVRSQLAGFDMDIMKTDLANQTSTELAFLNMAQNNRSSVFERESMLEAARIQASASGGKK